MRLETCLVAELPHFLCKYVDQTNQAQYKTLLLYKLQRIELRDTRNDATSQGVKYLNRCLN